MNDRAQIVKWLRSHPDVEIECGTRLMDDDDLDDLADRIEKGEHLDHALGQVSQDDTGAPSPDNLGSEARA